MASIHNQLNQGELALYSKLSSQRVIPVGVDLAARVFQVCYLTEKQQLKNKSLSRDAFLDFLKSPPFSKPMLVGFEACGACNYLNFCSSKISLNQFYDWDCSLKIGF